MRASLLVVTAILLLIALGAVGLGSLATATRESSEDTALWARQAATMGRAQAATLEDAGSNQAWAVRAEARTAHAWETEAWGRYADASREASAYRFWELAAAWGAVSCCAAWWSLTVVRWAWPPRPVTVRRSRATAQDTAWAVAVAQEAALLATEHGPQAPWGAFEMLRVARRAARRYRADGFHEEADRIEKAIRVAFPTVSKRISVRASGHRAIARVEARMAAREVAPSRAEGSYLYS